MDGFELYQEIIKKDNNAKVCFLTASELYYEKFRKKEFCALDKDLFIRKPIGNEHLSNKVNEMINKYVEMAEEYSCQINICDKRHDENNT
jgi:FixJ family two-component response regulator